MKILVIEPGKDRRADLTDAICELPGIEVHAAVAGMVEGRRMIACDPIDLVIVGELQPHELASLSSLAETHACAVICASTIEALPATLKRLVTRRSRMRTDTRRMTAEHPRAANANQTLDLKEWLPRTITALRSMVPDYIELVPMVAGDTPAVRCVPAILEHMVFDLVIQACAALPWGGTVWLTAGPGADGEVKLDVLEDGEGEIHDLTLRASAPACS